MRVADGRIVSQRSGTKTSLCFEGGEAARGDARVDARDDDGLSPRENTLPYGGRC